MKYYNGPVTLYWNQLWRVTFKIIDLTPDVRWVFYVTSFGFTFMLLPLDLHLCYFLWVYIYVTSFGFTFMLLPLDLHLCYFLWIYISIYVLRAGMANGVWSKLAHGLQTGTVFSGVKRPKCEADHMHLLARFLSLRWITNRTVGNITCHLYSYFYGCDSSLKTLCI
jgi:hypothetical protein